MDDVVCFSMFKETPLYHNKAFFGGEFSQIAKLLDISGQKHDPKYYVLYYPRPTLPAKGWIQACIVCRIPTSHTVQWGKKNIVAYLCCRCIHCRSGEVDSAMYEVFSVCFPGHRIS